MRYYTPKLEDIFPLMEYEAFIDERKCWSLETFYLNESHLSLIRNCLIRVKYLDKEDIEDLGFELKLFSDHNSKFYKITQYRGEDNLCSIVYNEISNWLCVEITINKEGKTIFAGQIKNKSELRRLMQQLVITQP